MLNERIKNLRLAKGLTLQQVGDFFGISPASVASWEKGKNQPDSRKLSQLADVLGTTVEFLINGSSSLKQIDIESHFDRVPFIKWVQLDEASKISSEPSLVQPLHSKLSKSGFATRFPGSNEMNWTQGPVPAGSLIFVDPEKILVPGGTALVQLKNKEFDLAVVQLPTKSGSFFLKLFRSGEIFNSDKEVKVLGSIAEWRISGVI